MAGRTAATAVPTSELEQAARVYRETAQGQAALIDTLSRNIEAMLTELRAANQAANDALQIMTSQMEKQERAMEHLVVVTNALVKATEALRSLPPGSAIRPGER